MFWGKSGKQIRERVSRRGGNMTFLEKMRSTIQEKNHSSAALAFAAAIDQIQAVSPEVAKSIVQELKDQRSYLKLIASENYCSLAVQLAMGNWMTDKYSEGYPGHRFYAGCENVDAIEGLAISYAKELFGSDHAYVQPHSGADANLVAFWAILTQKVQSKEIEKLGKKSLDELSADEFEAVRQLLLNQKIMGMGLGSGGHLTHGYRANVSAKMFQAVSYEVDPQTGLIDYHTLQKQAKKEKPLILIAGYSAYPRKIDFSKMREIADSVGAVLMVDMAHFAGLVAGKVFQGPFNPIPYAHIVTSTTHKTLRGPRGGLVLCTSEFKEAVDKGCPMVLGGPLPHIMAAKAVAFKEALSPSFAQYAKQVVANSQALAQSLIDQKVEVLTHGTDNHLLVVDVAKSFQMTGRQAESALREAHLTVNRNAVPKDEHGAWYTSGVRMGTAAVTTLGMKEAQMKEIGIILATFLRKVKPQEGSKAKVLIDPKALSEAKDGVQALLKQFPLYPELIID